MDAADDTGVFDSDATVVLVPESDFVTAKIGDEFPVELPEREPRLRFDVELF